MGTMGIDLHLRKLHVLTLPVNEGLPIVRSQFIRVLPLTVEGLAGMLRD